MEASLELVVRQTLQELGDGNHVCFDGFGTFSVSAKAIRPTLKQHDIRAESIRLKRIVFKTSKTLLRHAGFKFQRKPEE